LAYIAGTSMIVSASWDKTLKIWDFETSQLIASLEGHTEDVNTVTHIPNTKILASGSTDNTIKIWNYERKECINTLMGHE
jgi:WD40 repeat protein